MSSRSITSAWTFDATGGASIIVSQHRFEDGEYLLVLGMWRLALELCQHLEGEDANRVAVQIKRDRVGQEASVVAPALDRSEDIELAEVGRQQVVAGAEQRFRARFQAISTATVVSAPCAQKPNQRRDIFR